MRTFFCSSFAVLLSMTRGFFPENTCPHRSGALRHRFVQAWRSQSAQHTSLFLVLHT